MLKQGVELWQLLLVGVVLIAAIVWSHQQTHVELSEALDHEHHAHDHGHEGARS